MIYVMGKQKSEKWYKAMKNMIPWNKGTKGVMKKNRTSFKKGNKSPKYFLGKTHTEEFKQKVRMKLLGRPSPMIGKKHSEDTKLKMSLSHIGKKYYLGKKHTKEQIEKISKASKEHWKKDKYRKSVLGKREMSSLENKMLSIIKDNNLPYIFVGNGEAHIGSKIPDFININGEKIALEVFANRQKNEFRGGVEKWKKDREIYFLKYGWKVLFFSEIDTNNDKVLSSLATL